MNHFSQRLAILAILVAAPVTGEAATYSVTPVFVGAFTNDGTFTPIQGWSPWGSSGPVVVQYDFLVNVSGFAADQLGFANGVFTITPHLMTNTSAPGWNPSAIPNVDSNGATPGGIVPLLSDNADLADQDLKDILIGVATPLTTNPAVDPRFRFGRGTTANFNAGTAYLDLPYGPAFGFGIEVQFTQVSALYQDGAANRYIGLVDAGASLPVASIRFYPPEPASGMLLAIGAVVAATRGRR
jgi:hypothetical protein